MTRGIKHRKKAKSKNKVKSPALSNTFLFYYYYSLTHYGLFVGNFHCLFGLIFGKKSGLKERGWAFFIFGATNSSEGVATWGG